MEEGSASRASRRAATSALRSVVASPSLYSLLRRPERPAICLIMETDTGPLAFALPAATSTRSNLMACGFMI